MLLQLADGFADAAQQCAVVDGEFVEAVEYVHCKPVPTLCSPQTAHISHWEVAPFTERRLELVS